MKFLPLLVLAVAAFASPVMAEPWQRIPCIEDPRLTVTLLIKSPTSPADEEFVGWNIHYLALTGDPAMVQYLLPYLDQKTVALDSAQVAIGNTGVSTRACDLAYNELLILLDRRGEPFTYLFPPGEYGPKIRVQPEYDRRDKLIAELKAELKASP